MPRSRGVLELDRQTRDVVTNIDRGKKGFLTLPTLDLGKMSSREMLFCQVYVRTGNAMEAGEAIGLKEPSKNSRRWLRKPKIMQYVIALAESVRTEASQQEVRRMAQMDMERLAVRRLIEILRSPGNSVRGYRDILSAVTLGLKWDTLSNSKAPTENLKRALESNAGFKTGQESAVTTVMAVSEASRSPRLPETQPASKLLRKAGNGPEDLEISHGPQIVRRAPALEKCVESNQTAGTVDITEVQSLPNLSGSGPIPSNAQPITRRPRSIEDRSWTFRSYNLSRNRYRRP
jgi:hypothetical protein